MVTFSLSSFSVISFIGGGSVVSPAVALLECYSQKVSLLEASPLSLRGVEVNLHRGVRAAAALARCGRQHVGSQRAVGLSHRNTVYLLEVELYYTLCHCAAQLVVAPCHLQSLAHAHTVLLHELPSGVHNLAHLLLESGLHTLAHPITLGWPVLRVLAYCRYKSTKNVFNNQVCYQSLA